MIQFKEGFRINKSMNIFLLFNILVYFVDQVSSDRCGVADTMPSACANGWSSSQNYGYICPQMAMYSDSMEAAARIDFPETTTTFVYATAGGQKDEECGKCYQVQVLDAEQQWKPNFPLLVVQIINSGFDVLPHQLDLFMGAGGFGYFTACNSDCRSRACQGGTCGGPGMFSGTFDDWNDPQYADPNPCYSGGIKWLNGTTTEENLQESCLKLNRGNLSTVAAKATYDSCVRSNLQLFHQNFVSTNSKRVRCPPALVDVTMMQRADDANYPHPDPSLQLDLVCRGDRSRGRYCVTTMQDCCKPSCAWSGKAETVLGMNCVATCDRDGNVVGK